MYFKKKLYNQEMVNKYEKELIKRTSRVHHVCSNCGNSIKKGEEYISEEAQDRFLQSLNKRNFCIKCYKKHEDKLLDLETAVDKSQKILAF